MNEPSIHSLTLPKKIALPTKSEIEDIFTRLPRETLYPIYHVGMLQDPTQGNQSQEGPFLSASEFPDEWTEIAKLGGQPTWEIISPKPLSLIDALEITTTPHLTWAKNHGLIEEKLQWICPSTNEHGEPTESLHSTKADAEKEREHKRIKIIPKKMLLVTDALREFWTQREAQKSTETPSAWLTSDIVLTFLIEVAAHANIKHSPYGIWWNENLEPEMYSAPRIGLSPTKLLKNKGIQLCPV